LNPPETNGVLKKIRDGDRQVLKELYQKMRNKFLLWAERRYSGSSDTFTETYQLAFTILYYNVRDEKFKGDSSIETYLFGIGKNLLNKQVAARERDMVALDEVPEVESLHESPFRVYDTSYDRELVARILEKVGEPCKSVLTHYYFDNFSMDAIAENMGYKSAGVAKKKKCECLIRIRKLLAQAKNKINQ
jgi:RNA polymerase sigma factor, sigma-70 family